MLPGRWPPRLDPAVEAWPLLQEGMERLGLPSSVQQPLRGKLEGLPWTSALGVELHPDGRVDFGWCLRPAASLAEQLFLGCGALPGRLGRVLRAWREQPELGQVVDALWGEWDAEEEEAAVFLSLSPQWGRFPLPFRQQCRQRMVEVLGWEGPVPPLDGELAHVGVLPHREHRWRYTLRGCGPGDPRLPGDPAFQQLLCGPEPLVHLGGAQPGVEWRGRAEDRAAAAERLGLRLPAVEGWEGDGRVPARGLHPGYSYARRVAWIKWPAGKAYLGLYRR